MSGYRRYGRYRSYRGRRGYYRGPLGGLVGAFARIISLILFGLMFLLATADYRMTEAIDIVLNGGVLHYDQVAMSEYAQAQYDAEFATVPHEDNILIVVFADPKDNDYRTCVVMGSHVRSEVKTYLNDPELLHREHENEAFHPVSMEEKILGVVTGLISDCDSHFSGPNYYGSLLFCHEEVENEIYRVTNYTEIPVKSSSVERHLKKLCTDGLSAAVVIVDADEVLDRTIPLRVVYTLVLMGAIVAVIATVVIFLVRNRKKLGLSNETEEVSEPEETMKDYDKLDDNYWKDRY